MTRFGFRALTIAFCLTVQVFSACVSPTATKTLTATRASDDPAIPIADGRSEFELMRHKMVDETIINRGVTEIDVIRAMKSVPRHLFVSEQFVSQAYDDHPLPIGYGQTISQPYIVALMTQLLGLEVGDKVLEIGTGSGYQAAVLQELGYVDVYSIEIVPELADSAQQRLKRSGYEAISLKAGDGYYGWEEFAPFDAIIVTAAPDHLPAPLVKQLSGDGRIVIPIGPPGGYQTLWKFVYEGSELVGYNLGGVSFVPFTGEGIQAGESEEAP